jgi:hypothetical protein
VQAPPQEVTVEEPATEEVVVETETADASNSRNPWIDRLREAGPVVSPMAPVPPGGDLLRLRAALVHLDHQPPQPTRTTPPPAAAPPPAPRREAAPVNRRPAIQLDLGVDQVVDVAESAGPTRQHVAG